jgi:2-dehydropantoate 2-reductase
MKIAIYGTGGVGGRFGAFLARAGEETVFLARGEHLRAIRENGLILETPEEEILVRPALATDDPAAAGPVDVVLLGVKSWQVEESARAMAPLLGPETFVVPLQNGVEAADQLAGVLGPQRVLLGMCRTFSFVAAPGRIRSLGRIHTVDFGERDSSSRNSERAARLLRTLRSAGIQAEIPPDVHVALWQKFLMVVSVGGVGAVEQKPMGVLRSDPPIRARVRGAMEEIFALARARRVALPDDSVDRAMDFIDSLAPDGTSSLQRDIADGKPSELEAWNGAAVRLGREAGVATPVHDAIYERLLPKERAARERVSRD